MAGIMGMGGGIMAGWYPGTCIIPGYTEETGPSQVGPYPGPQAAFPQPQVKRRVWATRAQAGALTPSLGFPRP